MMIGAVAWRKALPDLLCRRLSGPCLGAPIARGIGAAGEALLSRAASRKVRLVRCWMPQSNTLRLQLYVWLAHCLALRAQARVRSCSDWRNQWRAGISGSDGRAD